MSIASPKATWHEVATCPVCGHDRFCSISDDGNRVCCKRNADAANDSSFEFAANKQDKNGDSFALWVRKGTSKSKQDHPAPIYSHRQFKGEVAKADILDRVYSAFLSSCDMADRDFYLPRGLSVGDVVRLRYRTHNIKRVSAIRGMIKAGLEPHLPFVPGFYVKEDTDAPHWSCKGTSGPLIPCRNEEGKIVALKVRDPKAITNKYRYISSAKIEWTDEHGDKHRGASPGSVIHFSLFELSNGSRETIRLTEGEVKADITTIKSGVWTISIPGVGSWRRGVKTLLDRCSTWKTRQVLIAFDSDFQTKKEVRLSFISLVRKLIEEVAKLPVEQRFEVTAEVWPVEAGKGIDDVFAEGKDDQIKLISGPELLKLVDDLAKQAGGIVAEEKPDFRPSVLIAEDEDRVNREVINHLGNDETIFQRASQLVDVLPGTKPTDGYAIAGLSEAKLRSRMTAVIRFQEEKLSRKTGDPEIVDVHPPTWCVSAVASYGEYASIRPLAGVVEIPIIRPDGTILDQPGYDRQTQILFRPTLTFPTIPSEVTKEDAQAAASRILALVQDFPFAGSADKSGWFASVLTPQARYAFEGPAPLFLFIANAPGSGKTLAANIAPAISLGRRIEPSSYTHKDEELRKWITGLAVKGDPLVLIDNVEGNFGGMSSLDAALTSTSWEGRLLGSTKNVRCPLIVTWLATGNNCNVVGDTRRRVLPIYLETTVENPEDRKGFHFPNLIDHVIQDRANIVADILTIFRAYHIAGRPESDLKSWGSFEGWSRTIRQIIAWLGMEDPIETRKEIRSQGDNELNALELLMGKLIALDVKKEGKTSSAILSAADLDSELKEAILELCPSRDGNLPASDQLAKKLRKYKKRVVKNKRLNTGERSNAGVKWIVESMDPKGCSSVAGVVPTAQLYGESYDEI